MDTSEQAFPPDIRVDVPTSARAYGYVLGGKDNFAVDREFMLETVARFPATVDIGRQNRLFLYRAVRYLARDAGIRQFLDMGSGLPTDNNVHQVAQRFRPDARVVYVDIDPIALTHGRALLADNAMTTVITADMRRPEEILDREETRALIDLSEPVAVLFLSVVHHLTEADDPRGVFRGVLERTVPGSHIAASQIVCEDRAKADDYTAHISGSGIPWRTRTPAEFAGLLDGLEPVEPGLVNLVDWRPDPGQPPLEPVDEPLRPYLGASKRDPEFYEYGGVLRKP